jgi:hypothetical protein
MCDVRFGNVHEIDGSPLASLTDGLRLVYIYEYYSFFVESMHCIEQHTK